MTTHHVKQHYVAKSYLAAWCDPATPENHEPYVWVFPAEGGEPRKRPPKKLFWEDDMYTRTIVIPGVLEARDLRLEAGLSTLEDGFVRIRRDFLDQKKPLPAAPAVKLLAFVAAQQARTPRMREHIRSQWGHALDLMDEMKASVDRMTPEGRDRLLNMPRLSSKSDESMSHDEVRKIVAEPLQSTLVPHVVTLTPLLTKLNMALLCTSGHPAFITSDEPCVWFDPAAHQRPPLYQGPALMHPTLEITMPLTPRCMLFLSRSGPIGYVDVAPDLVHELNRRTRAYAEHCFIGQTSEASPFWYERGEAPKPEELGPSVSARLA